MTVRGGFDLCPQNTPIPEIRVSDEVRKIEAAGDSFSFAVLGDMRWESEPRIAVLSKAQESEPLFMVNLGDAVEFSQKSEWERYVNELARYWDRDIPYFHIPGGHSLNVGWTGVKPEFFNWYFGKTNYYMDAASWRFIFLDSSRMFYLPIRQFDWLENILADADRKNLRSIIFMHHPPASASQGIDHALTEGQTDRLAKILEGHEIAAIFAAHIHKIIDYNWRGIPVYVTALNGSSWKNVPAFFRMIKAEKNKIEVSTVRVESHEYYHKPKQTASASSFLYLK